MSPTFDGWTRNADGTYSFYFGYLNRNRAEEIHVPVGPDNMVEGGDDRGQPTYFYPSDRDGHRRWWVFKVVVPENWPQKQRLVWTLKTKGRTNRAVAWLQPEYEVDPVLVGLNAGDTFLFSKVRRGGADAANSPPAVSGTPRKTVTLPEKATLTLTATDDGRPVGESGKPQGVRFRWILFRGPAGVRFEPETNGPFPTSPAKAETTVSFKEPGDYRLRAIASDEEWFSTYDIDVTVNPPPSGQAAR